MISACSPHQTASKTAQSWVLNPAHSSISIISTKNSKVSEVSNFTQFSGSIDGNLNLNISIDLNSLETNIPIRNERMQKHLFQSGMYPTADIRTQLTASDLIPGVHKITFDVDLHGVSSILEAEFMVFEQYGNKVITLHKPLIVDAATFGLESGISTLKNLAKLQSIDFTVPINLILSFQPLQN